MRCNMSRPLRCTCLGSWLVGLLVAVVCGCLGQEACKAGLGHVDLVVQLRANVRGQVPVNVLVHTPKAPRLVTAEGRGSASVASRWWDVNSGRLVCFALCDQGGMAGSIGVTAKVASRTGAGPIHPAKLCVESVVCFDLRCGFHHFSTFPGPPIATSCPHYTHRVCAVCEKRPARVDCHTQACYSHTSRVQGLAPANLSRARCVALAMTLQCVGWRVLLRTKDTAKPRHYTRIPSHLHYKTPALHCKHYNP
jgi:hypothetical protein